MTTATLSDSLRPRSTLAARRGTWLLGLSLGAVCGSCGQPGGDTLGQTAPFDGPLASAGAGGSLGSAGLGGSGGADQAGAPGSSGAPPVNRRLIAPLSTSTVTSQTPTLRWVLGPDSDGAHVELCRDRGCTQPVTSFDAVGDHGAPSAPLKPGVVFWRVTWMSHGVKGMAASPVWQFTVGHGSAPVDTSWGTTLDINGDGFADLATGTTEVLGGQIEMHLGSAKGLSSADFATLKAPTGSGAGAYVANAGDINGDGFADIVLRAVEWNKIEVHLGGESGPSPAPATVLSFPTGSYFGGSIASAGDVNGDGFADLVVSSQLGGSGGPREVFLYLGSDAGLSSSAAATLTPLSGNKFGLWAMSAGDINGDGFADLVLGESWAPDGQYHTAGPQKVYLYLGSAGGLAASPAATLSLPDWVGSGALVVNTGDINGDGFADLVVGAPEAVQDTGKAYVFLGGAKGLSASPSATLIAPHGSDFGAVMANAGDINGDGFADLVIAATDEDMVYIYSGSAAGLSSSPVAALSTPVGSTSMSGADDFNGDGFADLVVFQADMPEQHPNSLQVYLGGAKGLSTSPGFSWP